MKIINALFIRHDDDFGRLQCKNNYTKNLGETGETQNFKVKRENGKSSFALQTDS